MTMSTVCLISIFQTCIIISRHPELLEQVKLVALRPIISLVYKSCVELRLKLKQYHRIITGLTDHSVFMDSHFQNFCRVYEITFKHSDSEYIILSMVDSNSELGSYLTGRLWVWWNWRITEPVASKKALKLE